MDEQSDLKALRRASGTFEVKMEPQAAGPETAAVEGSGTQLGRMLLHKRFSGDLEGAGEGQMLTAVSDTPGSAGYVAIERFVGTLHGRVGSFVFQHSGTMDHGAQQLSITVVPGSGSGELAGLAGRFALRVDKGQHLYEFDYTL
ncbi:DUF3224 domain-containing protein [Ideonella sp.]|uniref:DUF3224 domain-containing protein n=1 Tax=Ideonella sp. TaxID=1929293 RepID=UPI0035B1F35B